MTENNTIAFISYTIMTGNLLAHDDPTEAQVAQYQDMLRDRLAAEYPTCDVTVRVERASGAGGGATVASDDPDCDTWSMDYDVDAVGHEVWEQWCKNLTLMIDDTQIEQLRDAAGQAGDLDLVKVCDRALDDGDEDARRRCAEVIDAARAMED
jgi:hypothetical protein